MPREWFLDDWPNVGDMVVFCGSVCLVKAVNRATHILTVRVMKGDYISYVYAEDVDRFDIRNKSTI